MTSFHKSVNGIFFVYLTTVTLVVISALYMKSLGGLLEGENDVV